jgi:plasmid stabilization system protein ParE
MRVEWTTPAEVGLDAYLGYLAARNPAIAPEARADIQKSTALLGDHPFLGRPAHWPGLRELSLLRWRKIAVYRVEEQPVLILALYDARQDLSQVMPTE